MKRVGNLATLENTRGNSFNRTLAADSLRPQNLQQQMLFQQNSPMKDYTPEALDNLKQQNQTLRERLNLQRQNITA